MFEKRPRSSGREGHRNTTREWHACEHAVTSADDRKPKGYRYRAKPVDGPKKGFIRSVHLSRPSLTGYRIPECSAFVVEQPSFAFYAAAIAGERAVGANHP